MQKFSIIRETPGSEQECSRASIKVSQPSELRFKMEPIGVHPEDDDDLDTCPSRVRPNWPHQISPWWKPSDRFEKPPYSYATLIAHAILSSKDGRLTLSDIYRWISEAYPYYKRGVKGWQNSIRHNLSLNKKWFIKQDRRPTQAHPGKGGYWTLQPMTETLFVENLTQAGGHSRRHHDIGTFASLSSKSLEGTDSPNIHITRPEDYQVKKIKNSLPGPRIRNNSADEIQHEAPKTQPKSFVIRFNREDTSKRGKKRRVMEDAADDIPVTKKRNSTITNEILQDFWMHEPDRSHGLLLTSGYSPLYCDPEAQNLLCGLQQPAVVSCHPDMKTIDLQYGSVEKVVHCPQSFELDLWSDNHLSMGNINNFSVEQYLDFNVTLDNKQPSDLLTEESFAALDSYWPDEVLASQCFDYC